MGVDGAHNGAAEAVVTYARLEQYRWVEARVSPRTMVLRERLWSLLLTPAPTKSKRWTVSAMRAELGQRQAP